MAMMRSMVPLRSSVARVRTRGGGLAQVAVLLFQAVQFLAPCGGRTLVPPAPELLRIDIDELQLLAMDAFHPVDGGVVENMRLGTCFGQRLEVVSGVAQGAVRSCWRQAASG